MTRIPNPYRNYLGNVHLRRIFILTVVPFWFISHLFREVILTIVKETKRTLSVMVLAFKDGKSYH